MQQLGVTQGGYKLVLAIFNLRGFAKGIRFFSIPGRAHA